LRCTRGEFRSHGRMLPDALNRYAEPTAYMGRTTPDSVL